MLKADNYNKYDYDQASGEKLTRRRRYTLRGLSMRLGLEIQLRSRDQKSDIRRLMKEDK